MILLAFWMTLKLSALSAAGSLILGTVLAAMRVAPLPILRAVGTLYVNTLRNTPLTLIILFCGLGLGSILTIATVQTTNYFWLAVSGWSPTRRHSSARCCGPESTPFRLARLRPPAPLE